MAMQNDGPNVIPTYNYDVFLSFHGEDTGMTFTSNLYHALHQKRIKTFFQRDDKKILQPGGDWPSIQEAIQQSRMSIVVFSENYAFSIGCLDDLVSIIDGMKNNNKLVWPIFYKVEQEQLKKKEGRFQEFGETREVKEEGRNEGLNHGDRTQEGGDPAPSELGYLMPQRKEALSQFATLFGWHYRTNEYEYELIQKIVKEVVQSLPRYDIFLSFCGEDTRHSFTGYLYRALCREGFKTFLDEEGLVIGNQISKTLLEAIEKSRLSIVVFSENYGYSSWCLNEFVKIIECMENKGQLVWPIFYKIKASDVWELRNSYGRAKMDDNWKSALLKVATLREEDQIHIKNNESESKVIKDIVKKAIKAEKQQYNNPVSPSPTSSVNLTEDILSENMNEDI